MLDTPFSPWPAYSHEEREAVQRVLTSGRVNYWTGKECRKFEREFADWVGTEHAVALANGTLALEVALHAVGVSSGEEVIVTPRSFIASASCVESVGATPVFADVDAESQNISAESIRASLTPKTRAIICVHLGGMPCDMQPILELADEHGLKVVEDCAQAHGAEYRGEMVGSLGDVAAWSFCQDKIMSTGGEGGMVTTNCDDVWRAAWSYKDHGKSWGAVYEREHGPGFRWLHESFGTNARMLEVQAAIGRVQLERMPEWRARRIANAARLRTICSMHDVVRVLTQPENSVNACYRFYAFVEPERLAQGWSRDRIVEEINARGVPCYHGPCPEIYRETAFENAGLQPSERLPVAMELGHRSMMMLVHPTLKDSEIDLSCEVLDSVLRSATS